jgi:hypothetical protein
MKILPFNLYFYYLVVLLFSNGCCNMNIKQSKLDKQLDSYNIVGAIETMNSPCFSKIPHINATKALLSYRLSMDEKNKKEQARFKKDALELLRGEAASGYPTAISILESYDKIGDAYFLTFPWDSLLGPGPHQNQKRS